MILSFLFLFLFFFFYLKEVLNYAAAVAAAILSEALAK